MNRRQILKSMGVATAAMTAGLNINAGDNVTIDDSRANLMSEPMDLALGNDHFLSKINPAATVDQRDAEILALKISAEPELEAARKEAARRFNIMLGHTVPEGEWRDFDEMLEEWAFNYILLAVNGDANYPKVVGYKHAGPHEWFGIKMKGSRGPTAGECVENYYAWVPLDENARYELHGKIYEGAVEDYVFATTGNRSHGILINVIDGRNLKVNPDGTYVITMDPQAANGRSNHLQTTRDTMYLFIRNSHVEWRQKPHALRVRRLDPPAAPPMTYEEKVAMAARLTVDDVPTSCMYQRMLQIQPLNVATPVVMSAEVGGSAVQKLTVGRLDLQDDEAFVFNVKPGGSRYWNVIRYNWWFTTGDFWSKTASLNTSQSVADEDGSYTYVFSNRDPGIHNWIDTDGMQHTKYVVRFRQLPEEESDFWTPGAGYSRHKPGGNPEVDGKVVKFSQLGQALPGGVKRINAADRSAQIKKRIKDYNSWWEV